MSLIVSSDSDIGIDMMYNGRRLGSDRTLNRKRRAWIWTSRHPRTTNGIYLSRFCSSLLLAFFILITMTTNGILAQKTPCQVIEGMICECQKTVLDCQTDRALPALIISPDSSQRFRTIMLSFGASNFVVKREFFQPLTLIMPRLPGRRNDIVSVNLQFSKFRELVLEPHSFSRLFDKYIEDFTKLTLDFYSKDVVLLDAQTFHGLKVGILELFLNAGVSSKNTFDILFNGTRVSNLLRIEGTLIPHDYRPNRPFTGDINRLMVTKQVGNINANEFPPYPVKFYFIVAHNSKDMNSLSFQNYTNLKGLSLITDYSFPLSARKLEGFNYLEELVLNLEMVDHAALTHVASTLKALTLGGKVKHIDNLSLESLKKLQRLDIRELKFTLLSYPARCSLAQIIHTTRPRLDVVIDSGECDCHKMFILYILKIKPLCDDIGFNTEQCAINSHCEFVKNYYVQKMQYSSADDDDVVLINSSYLHRLYDTMSKNNEDGLQYDDEYYNQQHHRFGVAGSTPIDHLIPGFDHGYDPNGNHPMVIDIDASSVGTDEDRTRPQYPYGHKFTDHMYNIEGDNVHDVEKNKVDMIPGAGSDSWTATEPTTRQHVNTNYKQASGHPLVSGLNLNWIPIVVICIALILALTVALLVWHYNYRRRRGIFKPIPTHSSL